MNNENNNDFIKITWYSTCLNSITRGVEEDYEEATAALLALYLLIKNITDNKLVFKKGGNTSERGSGGSASEHLHISPALTKQQPRQKFMIIFQTRQSDNKSTWMQRYSAASGEGPDVRHSWQHMNAAKQLWLIKT